MEYDKKIFQNNMKFLRRKSGLSQTKFAQELGISQKTISMYEDENPNPTLNSLLIISRRFNVSIEALLSWDLEEGTFNFGTRKTKAGEFEYSHFEGMTYNVYYCSERSDETFHHGLITFDEEYDKEHLFLHGTTSTGHTYDCKMVIEETHTFYVYGTEIEMPRRFHIGMYYPDFREEMKYFAGIGIVTRIDSRKNITGMRVVLTRSELDVDDRAVEEKLLYFLTSGNNSGDVFVNRDLDDEFREWVRGLSNH